MTTFKVRVKKYDLTLLVVLMLLILAGLVILYSTSVYNGEVKFHDAMYYLKKQLFATALGLAVMYLVAGIDYHIWKYAARSWLCGSGGSFRFSPFSRRRIQWVQKMVVFGPFFVSAF